MPALRRRWSFSLWTLLVAVTLLAVCIHLAWRRRVAAAEHELMESMQTAKAKAAQDWWDGMQFNSGGPPDWDYRDLYNASVALKDAQLEIATDRRGRIAVLTSHCDRMGLLFRRIDGLHLAGAKGGEPVLHAESKCRWIEAKIWLKEEEIK